MPEEFLTSDQVVTAGDLLRRLAVVDAKVAELIKRAEMAEAANKQHLKDWCKLMVEIAKLDPSWDPEMGEPEWDDADFQECYDPWEGLRQISAKIGELARLVNSK
jgi:hypothetical protein